MTITAATHATAQAAPAGGAPGPEQPADIIEIVLVDDHAVVRQGLRSVLERDAGLRVVGEAGSASEALAVVATRRPHVVLLDLRLSASSETEGIELCARVTRDHPGTAVLVLTTVIDDSLVLEAIHQGARGYVVKEVDTSELIRAIRAVRRGESAFDSRSAAAMVRGINAEAPAESRRITERELDVLRLLARGLSNRAIGKQLFISETTAKFHVCNIMRKLQVRRRAEAVYVASKEGLI